MTDNSQFKLPAHGDQFVLARKNPFAVEHVTQIPFRFERHDWHHCLTRLQQLNYRAAIVGPQGTGKSTLLLELSRRIELDSGIRGHFVVISCVRSEQRKLIDRACCAAQHGHVVLIDSIERLMPVCRWRLFRSSGRRAKIVVTSHHPWPLLPFRLPTLIQTTTSDELLDYLLSELKMSRPPIRRAARELLQKHRGNVRNVLRELYDVHAELK